MAKKTAPHRSSRRDFGVAFLPDPASGDSIPASDAQWLAEEFIAGATSGEFVGEDARNEVSIDEVGGPYVAEAAVVYLGGTASPASLRDEPPRAFHLGGSRAAPSAHARASTLRRTKIAAT